ncbi:MAG TPA: DUF2155 domain-containing protein [Nitrospirota bacterium]|jgi:hypothetical protein
MLKKMSLLLLAGAFIFSLSACGKQESAEQKAAAPAAPAGEANLALPKKGESATVNVPAEIKGKWKAIKVSVEDKNKKSKKDVEVAIGKEIDLPGTNLKLKAVEFVPNFVMQGLNITSASAEPNNPAAKVVITEGGKEIFNGWLFQKFPTTHAFSHPTYAVTLSGWVQS